MSGLKRKHMYKLILAALIFGALFLTGCGIFNFDERKMDKYYEKLCNRECLTSSEMSNLYSIKKDGSRDAKILYNIAEFCEKEADKLDIIYNEEIVADVSYINIIADCDYYLLENCTGKYADLNNELYSHIMNIIEKNPGSISFDSEKSEAAGTLPYAGMKTIYFRDCAIGVPDSRETREVDGRTFYIYNWHSQGNQIYYARACYGYVIEVYDYTYKLNRSSGSSDKGSKKNSKSSGNSGNSGNSSNSGSSGSKNNHSSYDEGYDDVYDNEDYDIDRYYKDSDYADGVDDALEDWDEEYGEDW